MKASLRLEAIGDDSHALGQCAGAQLRASGNGQIAHLFSIPSRAWCAQITGRGTRWAYDRVFLRPRKDYTHANNIGSRGVYLFYTLESGHLYEVRAPRSWSRADRYFCTVTPDGTVQRLTQAEVDAWLRPQRSNAHSG